MSTIKQENISQELLGDIMR